MKVFSSSLVLWFLPALLSATFVHAQEPAKGQAPKMQQATAADYANVPQSAKDILKALKKLDIKISIGISYETYSKDVENVYPDIKLFLESEESRKYPELSAVFRNASDCYLLVREEWHDEIYSEPGVVKLRAAMFGLYARKVLWLTASENVLSADVLVSGNESGIATFLQKKGPECWRGFTLLGACLNAVKCGVHSTPPQKFTHEYFPAAVLERCKEQGRMNDDAAKLWRELDGLLAKNEGLLRSNEGATGKSGNEPEVEYLTSPFDMSIAKLPAHFVGHDPQRLFDVLVEKSRTIRKPSVTGLSDREKAIPLYGTLTLNSVLAYATTACGARTIPSDWRAHEIRRASAGSSYRI